MKTSKIIFSLIALAVIMTPALSGAVTIPTDSSGVPEFTSFDSIAHAALNFMWMLFFVLAVIMFIVAGIIFLTAQGDPGKVAQARQFVLWGVVGIVVAILAFSIVTIVQEAF